jgi:4-hydroxybenzoate polyprenyltransferase
MSETRLREQTRSTEAKPVPASVLVDLVKLARPHQWVKNVFVFPALIFGMKLRDMPAVGRVMLTFVAFCLIASGIYALNDVLDREEDRLHVKKSNRPIASGRVSVRAGMLLACVCVAAGLLLSDLAGIGTDAHRGVLFISVIYVLLMIAYNAYLKHQVILDVMAIAIGFVLRATAGAFAAASDPIISPWLLVCTFTLCLFLGFGKRECELGAFSSAEEAANHRPTLIHYTPYLLSHLLTISAGIAVLTFLFYTLDPKTGQKFHSSLFIYTIPLVFYGVFRYTMLVQSGKVSGPNEVLLADRPFLITVAVWAAVAIAIVYCGGQIEGAFRWVMGQSQAAGPPLLR